MGHVDARKVVAVHHGLELVHGGVDEQRWVGRSAAAPDDIWGGAIVPVCGLGYDVSAFLCGGDVGGDVVKSLRGGSSALLYGVSTRHLAYWYGRGMADLELFNGFLEFAFCPSDNHNIRSFSGELFRRVEAKAG